MRPWNKKRGDFVRQRITNNNPVVRFVFEEMHRQRIHERDFSERVGFHRDTLRGWRTRAQPRINDIEDCLDFLGYKLKVVRKGYGEADE